MQSQVSKRPPLHTNSPLHQHLESVRRQLLQSPTSDTQSPPSPTANHPAAASTYCLGEHEDTQNMRMLPPKELPDTAQNIMNYTAQQGSISLSSCSASPAHAQVEVGVVHDPGLNNEQKADGCSPNRDQQHIAQPPVTPGTGPLGLKVWRILAACTPVPAASPSQAHRIQQLIEGERSSSSYGSSMQGTGARGSWDGASRGDSNNEPSLAPMQQQQQQCSSTSSAAGGQGGEGSSSHSGLQRALAGSLRLQHALAAKGERGPGLAMSGSAAAVADSALSGGYACLNVGKGVAVGSSSSNLDDVLSTIEVWATGAYLSALVDARGKGQENACVREWGEGKEWMSTSSESSSYRPPSSDATPSSTPGPGQQPACSQGCSTGCSSMPLQPTTYWSRNPPPAMLDAEVQCSNVPLASRGCDACIQAEPQLQALTRAVVRTTECSTQSEDDQLPQPLLLCPCCHCQQQPGDARLNGAAVAAVVAVAADEVCGQATPREAAGGVGALASSGHTGGVKDEVLAVDDKACVGWVGGKGQVGNLRMKQSRQVHRWLQQGVGRDLINNNNIRLVTLAEHTSDHGKQTNSNTKEKGEHG